MTSWDYFWTFASPVMDTAVIIEVLLSVFLFWKNQLVLSIICAVLTLAFSILALFSVGIYALIIAWIQLAGVLFLLKKRKNKDF
ncbi:hypothetical protein E4665_14675 [Sporolactobacillus shoreae]|uniref:Uncharacterized protein n=1 Tax=Sporolactobacillus shoreae TaxID=1465501 RepID=A0A4Z0GKU2_9BACL|nr:hypothetical protein [Sporolactobacillus shoreae]TGA96650.1 hypothetical protein E4665_14675 [Sporolactobacillus shoreae]